MYLQANATKVQKRTRKPRSPVQQAADVIEHVLSTGGEDYLETAQHLYAWWQLALLDVYSSLILGMLTALGLIGLLLFLLLQGMRRILSSSTTKIKDV